jgi:hypothetical protein
MKAVVIQQHHENNQSLRLQAVAATKTNRVGTNTTRQAIQ